MDYKLGFLIIILLIISSCGQQTQRKNNKEVLIHRFGMSNEKQRTDTSYMELTSDSLSSIALYKVYNHPDSSHLFYYSKRKNIEDSILYYNNNPCKELETKIYTINNRKYTISTYNYDIENSYDEESIIYFSHDYGIMIIYNFGWLIMESVFEYNEESNLLLQEIISDTTNDFPLVNRKEIINYCCQQKI